MSGRRCREVFFRLIVRIAGRLRPLSGDGIRLFGVLHLRSLVLFERFEHEVFLPLCNSYKNEISVDSRFQCTGKMC